MTELEQAEAIAWKWLLSLDRIDWQTAGYPAYRNQVIVRVVPGDLGARSGAPGVEVSAAHPQTKGRLRAKGNSLFEAVCRLQRLFWEAGVRLSFPDRTLWEARHGPGLAR